MKYADCLRGIATFSLLLSVAANGESPVDTYEIEEVLVTAQKLERSLKETKESVAVITADQIAERPLFTLEDIYNQTANAYQLGNGEGFGIRGVSMGSTSTGAGTGELGSYYIDGVAFTGFAKRFGPQALWDIKQVEILRGPQSTNVGRSALAGAVSMVTERPDFNAFDSAVRLRGGNYGTQELAAMVNLPTAGNSALRLTAETYSSDGFIENPFLGTDEFDARDNQTYRARWAIDPSKRTNILLTAQYATTERGQNLFLVPLSTVEQRENYSNLEAREDYDAFSASVDVDFAVNDSWTIRSITSFIDGEYDRFDDDDNTSDGGNAFRGRVAEDRNWAEELRFTYTSDRLQGVIGAYYTEIDLENTTQGLVNIAPAIVGVPAQLLPFYPVNIEVGVNSPFESKTTNIAIFTEWEWSINDDWSLWFGARFDREEKDNVARVANELLTPLPDPITAGQQAELIAPGSGPFVEAGVAQVNALLLSQITANESITSTDYDAFLPQVGITRNFADDSSLSFFVKRAYRAGDVELSLANGISEYDPEFLTNYELSYRKDFAEDKYSLYANAYYGDWTDQQVSFAIDGNIFNTITINAGESTLKGVELELTGVETDAFSWWTSVGYSSAKFDEFDTGTDDFSGNTFAGTPEWTAAAGGSFQFRDRYFVNSSVTYQSDAFSDVQNQFDLDARVLVNLRAGYSGDRFDFSIYATNLLDEIYLTTVATGISSDADSRIVRVGAPREYGAQLTFHF